VPMIREAIVTTIDSHGTPHIAPLGLIEEGDLWILAPFRPSTTLDNLATIPFAVASYTDDPLVFAGLVTGRKDWPLCPSDRVQVPRLAGALAHAELEVSQIEDHEERPRFHCRVVHQAQHAPFEGFNRARNAVLEAAILVTRLHILPQEKVEREFDYLSIAIEKTAGPREREAWCWLIEKRDAFFAAKTRS
jgi:hypothetical protein